MKALDRDIKIIGHRGAPAIEPENTLKSFQKAIELGCEMIETDARLTRDGEVVLIHDSTLGRTTNKTGFVKNKVLEELKELDAGEGERIPTLEESWNLIKGRAELNIEIKSPQALKKVISFIQKEKIEDQVLVSSRYYWIIAKVKKSNPSLRMGFVSYMNLASIWQALRMKAESLHPVVPIINKKLVNKAHQNGLKVYPFPLGTKREDPEKVKKLIEMGIDGIFLNDPEIIHGI